MTVPTVAVCVPWRPTPDRIHAFRHVSRWYMDNFPDWWFGTADSGHEPFNRAGSRNACVRLAEHYHADIVVVNDADTIPDRSAVAAAVYGAADDGLLHFGLDRMLYLDEAEQEAYDRGEMPTREALLHDSSVWAIQPKSYWKAGGQDERFLQWGGEDNAFQLACQAILGRSVWHIGTAISMFHDGSCRDVGSERWQREASAPLQRYVAVQHNTAKMQQLIEEEGRLSAHVRSA